MAKPIEEGWLEYRRTTLDPLNAPLVQVEETRKAFYFGAIWLLTTLIARMSPEHEPTEADLRLMDDVEAEHNAFLAQMRREGGGDG